MTKYRKYFQEMFEANKEVFTSFKKVHDEYIKDPDKWQDEFNKKGEQVVEIVRSYELKLTSHSESGQYGKFSSTLADKFWNEVKHYLPKIDFVGVTSA